MLILVVHSRHADPTQSPELGDLCRVRLRPCIKKAIFIQHQIRAACTRPDAWDNREHKKQHKDVMHRHDSHVDLLAKLLVYHYIAQRNARDVGIFWSNTYTRLSMLSRVRSFARRECSSGRRIGGAYLSSAV